MFSDHYEALPFNTVNLVRLHSTPSTNHDSLFTVLQSGLQFAKQTQFKLALMNVYFNLGVFEEKFGRRTEAMMYYDSTLNLAQRYNYTVFRQLASSKLENFN